MNKYSIDTFKKGWFIGNFEPSLFKTEAFEVAIKSYKKGDKEDFHYHKIATEYTIFNDGKFRMGENVYVKGDIVEILPFETTDFECLESGNTTVVKIPCVLGDKYTNGL